MTYGLIGYHSGKKPVMRRVVGSPSFLAVAEMSFFALDTSDSVSVRSS